MLCDSKSDFLFAFYHGLTLPGCQSFLLCCSTELGEKQDGRVSRLGSEGRDQSPSWEIRLCMGEMNLIYGRLKCTCVVRSKDRNKANQPMQITRPLYSLYPAPSLGPIFPSDSTSWSRQGLWSFQMINLCCSFPLTLLPCSGTGPSWELQSSMKLAEAWSYFSCRAALPWPSQAAWAPGAPLLLFWPGYLWGFLSLPHLWAVLCLFLRVLTGGATSCV